MVAWLLLLAQATSLLLVPLHAVAHAGVRAESNGAVSAGYSATAQRLASLFGHDQGGACDDWAAAFSLDSNPGKLPPLFKADAPVRERVACNLPAVPPASQPDPFRARAPPRS